MNKAHKIELVVGLTALTVAGILLWRYEKSAHAVPLSLPPPLPLPPPQAPASMLPPAQLQPPPPQAPASMLPPAQLQRPPPPRARRQASPQQPPQQPFGPGFLPQVPLPQMPFAQMPPQQPFGPGFLPQVPYLQMPLPQPFPQPMYIPVPVPVQPQGPLTPMSQGFPNWATMIAQLGIASGPSLSIRGAQHNLNVILNAGLVEDGRMGTKTFNAIRQFQSTYGLPVTGALDLETRSALQYFILSATMPGTLMTDSRGQTWTVPPLGGLPVTYTPLSAQRYIEV